MPHSLPSKIEAVAKRTAIARTRRIWRRPSKASAGLIGMVVCQITPRHPNFSRAHCFFLRSTHLRAFATISSRAKTFQICFFLARILSDGIARQQQPLRDLDQVRAFLSGAGPTAFLDMPWIAARVAGAHEMILRLPDGYGTRLGERGTALSAGQRQRIGLARAVFGRPFLVLDEPNANLDADGENALVNAIEILRNEQSIVISHRPNALAALNMAMVIYGGRAFAFGPREDVFARVARRGAANLGSRVSRVAAGVVPSPNPLTVRPRATMTRTMSTSRRRRLSGSCDDCKDFLTKSAISSGSPMQLICDAMIDRRFGHASDAPL